MASSSAKERRNEGDKKGGLETKMEEDGLKIETKTMGKERAARLAER